MNRLGDILHFMSKCVNIMKSYLKMYLNQRNFIAIFKKLLNSQLQEYATKTGIFILKN